MTRAMVVAFAFLTLSCQSIEPLRPTPSEPPEPPVNTCGSVGEALIVFNRHCETCHQGSRQYPNLTPAGVVELVGLESRRMPGEQLIVPGDPEASWLFRKMSHTPSRETGALMPLGADEPIAELAMIENWIAEGAPTECDDLPPREPIPYDPNALDRGELFTCADPGAPRSSPARVRRIDAREFNALAIGKAGTNPLSAPEGTRYSTYAEGNSVDTPTLQLLMSQFPQAVIEWTVPDPQQSGARRMYGSAQGAGCVSSGTPDDACIDGYIERLLRRGNYGRDPSPEEHARLRSLLVDALAREDSEDIPRRETLELVAQAARLSSGTLFHPELGENEEARRRLTDGELGLALSSILSASPAGLPIPNIPGGILSDEDPDLDNLDGGRLNRIALAVEDGTIGDAATRVALFRHYAGGVVADRRPDLSTRAADHDPRGEFWIADNLRRFFQEWLDYGSANTRFKQSPDLTSGFEDDDTGPSFNNLRSSSNGDEATLVQHLDDLIARVVVETDEGSGDVFEELMTTTTWHLPSNLSAGSTIPCTDDSVCGEQTCTHTGYCTDSTRRSHYWMQAVFGIRDNVGTAREDRWVEMDEGQRMGVLTHPAWLAAHGGNFEDDASLVVRGNWIRRRLFCQSFGDLSDVRGLVAMLPPQPDDGMLSARQRVYQATEDPETENAASCFGCHQFMNSLGNPFELYNHAGFERAYDHGGAPDGSTVVDNLPDPALNRAYATPMEMVQAFGASEEARRGFVRHAFRFFMGRDEVLEDACTLVEMEAALAENGSFFAMMEALISTETFTHRHAGGV
ncbi:MAG: DUF1588 domain-containing protein [Sandaracinaceae bacterium]